MTKYKSPIPIHYFKSKIGNNDPELLNERDFQYIIENHNIEWISY